MMPGFMPSCLFCRIASSSSFPQSTPTASCRKSTADIQDLHQTLSTLGNQQATLHPIKLSLLHTAGEHSHPRLS